MNNAAKTKESGTESQCVTDSSSSVVKSADSKDGSPETKSQKQSSSKQHKRFWLDYDPMERFTAILALFTVIYSTSFLYELYITNRPYITVNALSTKGIEAGGIVSVKLMANNTGHTPAYSARIYGTVEYVKYPIDINATFKSYPKDLATLPQMTIFPSTPVGLPLLAPKHLPENVMKLIKQDNIARIAAWGTLLYWDMLGFRHYTDFCFLFSENGGEAEYCSCHNVAK